MPSSPGSPSTARFPHRTGSRAGRRRRTAGSSGSWRTRLDGFADNRNDPGGDGGSEMSPYLHYGQVSPVTLAVLAREHGGRGTPAFLEELVVRRELAVNFVRYNEHYDTFSSLPAWAHKTLALHRGDRREYVYSLDELDRAETHDPYWNAAQQEMVKDREDAGLHADVLGQEDPRMELDARGSLRGGPPSQQQVRDRRAGPRRVRRGRLVLRQARPPVGGATGLRHGAVHECDGGSNGSSPWTGTSRGSGRFAEDTVPARRVPDTVRRPSHSPFPMVPSSSGAGGGPLLFQTSLPRSVISSGQVREDDRVRGEERLVHEAGLLEPDHPRAEQVAGLGQGCMTVLIAVDQPEAVLLPPRW